MVGSGAWNRGQYGALGPTAIPKELACVCGLTHRAELAAHEPLPPQNGAWRLPLGYQRHRPVVKCGHFALPRCAFLLIALTPSWHAQWSLRYGQLPSTTWPSSPQEGERLCSSPPMPDLSACAAALGKSKLSLSFSWALSSPLQTISKP